MKMVSGSLFVLVATALTISGCDDKQSSDLETKDITATFDIELVRDTTETKIKAQLRQSEASSVGPPPHVSLSGEDKLSVLTDKNDDIALTGSSGNYEATIGNQNATTFTFRLKRALGTTDTKFTLPGPLALTDSPEGKTYKTDDKVKFTWSNKATNATSKIFVSGQSYPCGGGAVTLAQLQRIPFEDRGEIEIEVPKLYNTGTPKAGDCVKVILEREVTDKADGALDAASAVHGKRTDRVEIKIN
jgi:hypothetical protein